MWLLSSRCLLLCCQECTTMFVPCLGWCEICCLGITRILFSSCCCFVCLLSGCPQLLWNYTSSSLHSVSMIGSVERKSDLLGCCLWDRVIIKPSGLAFGRNVAWNTIYFTPVRRMGKKNVTKGVSTTVPTKGCTAAKTNYRRSPINVFGKSHDRNNLCCDMISRLETTNRVKSVMFCP